MNSQDYCRIFQIQFAIGKRFPEPLNKARNPMYQQVTGYLNLLFNHHPNRPVPRPHQKQKLIGVRAYLKG